MNEHRLMLIPGAAITISYFTSDANDAFGADVYERFARLFRETWEQIPLEDSSRMLDYWRLCREKRNKANISSDITESSADLPLIQLIPLADVPFNGVVFGQDRVSGTELSFPGDVIAQLSDIGAKTLIAHELSCVTLYAMAHERETAWKSTQPLLTSEEAWDYVPYESSVITMMAQWGFDDITLDVELLQKGLPNGRWMWNYQAPICYGGNYQTPTSYGGI